MIYETGEGTVRFLTEPVSWILFTICPKIIPDFWIFLAITKCLFLYSIIKLLSAITARWMSCVALLITSTLSFLLFDNPLRYVNGLAFVNFALLLSYKHITKESIRFYYLKLFALLLLAVFCHNSCAIFLFVIPILPLVVKIAKINRVMLFFIYMLFTIVSSNISMLSGAIGNFLLLMEASELNNFSSYEIEDNSNIFSIGNLLRVLFLMFILITRNVIVHNNKNGNVIFSFAVLYCFMARVFIIVPSGFRMPMPFASFYMIYIFYLIISRNLYGKVMIAYIFISFAYNTWTSVGLIPYSNSIPYILMGHKDLDTRYWNNFKEYKARMGKDDEAYDLYEGPWR